MLPAPEGVEDGAPDNEVSPDRQKIADIVGVRAHGNEPEVELWRNEMGRLVVVAYNEGGHCAAQVDLWDIIGWLQAGPGRELVLDNGPSPDRAKVDPA